MSLGVILLLALTRAELLQRFRAPVVTQAEGFVKVYADCPEDMRREFQQPVARFAAETVGALYAAEAMKPRRFSRPALQIYVGDERTNNTSVVAHAATNAQGSVTRIYLPSPAHADLERLRVEIVKSFFRSIRGEEVADAEAVRRYRRANPALRIADRRLALETWLTEGRGLSDEEGIAALRRVIAPGHASRRDVLIFASRLFLYPPEDDLRFLGRRRSLSFAEALRYARTDPCIRIMATLKAREMTVFGGGRSPFLYRAAQAYARFLTALGANETDRDDLVRMLDEADVCLNVAYERAE